MFVVQSRIQKKQIASLERVDNTYTMPNDGFTWCLVNSPIFENFDFSKIVGLIMENYPFFSCKLDGSNFNGMNLDSANFQNSSLQNCDFRNVETFIECNFLNCNLTGSQMSMTKAQFIASVNNDNNLEGTIWIDGTSVL